MRLNTKILMGFLIIVILIIASVGINYKLNSDRLDKTQQIRDVEAPLELLVENVISYDAILTGDVHVSLLHAQKGDINAIKDYKMNYDEVRAKLDTILKVDARNLIEKSEMSKELKDTVYNYLGKLNEINLKLVDLDASAFDAMGKGDIEKAYALVVGEDYQNDKKEFSNTCNDWNNVELNVTSTLRNQIIQESNQLNYINLSFSAAIIVLAVAVSFLTSRSISRPIEKLTEKVSKITKGNIDIQLDKSSIDEIQSLTDSLSRILASLKLAILRTGMTKEEMGIGEAIKAKEEAENKYNIFFNSIGDAITIVDPKTMKFVDFNNAAEKLTGYSRKELSSMSFDSIHPKEKIGEIAASMKKSAETQTTTIMETEILTKDKKRVSVILSGGPIKIGDEMYMQAIFKDITERKKEEVKVKMFSDAIASSINAVAISDMNGKIIYVNPKWEEMHQYSTKEAMEMTIPQLVPKEESGRLMKEIMPALKEKGGWTGELSVLKKNKIKLPVLLSCSMIKDDKGKQIAMMASFIDITERKMMEEKIEKSEEKYKILYETSSDAIMTLEPPDWKFTDVNPAAIKMFDVKDVKEFNSLGPEDLSPEKQPDGQLSSAKAKKMIEKAMKEGSNFFEWTHKRYRGEDFPATVLLTKVKMGDKEFLQATVRNMSKEKEVEDYILEKKEKKI